MKRLNEHHIIATDQEMVDAGLCNFHVSEENRLSLWKFMINNVFKTCSWAGIYNMETETIPTHLNYIYEIDGLTYYIADFRPTALEAFYKGTEDQRIFRDEIQVFFERGGGIRLVPDEANCNYKKLARVSAEFSHPMTPEAFRHNHAAWMHNLKSEYVEDTFAVFTPCGDNKLYFWIQKRSGNPEQVTYMA